MQTRLHLDIGRFFVLSLLIACSVSFAATPVVTAPATQSGAVGTAVSVTVTATNTPTSFSAVGLPSGLTIARTGVISGKPTIGGIFNAVISATNASGTGSASTVFTISGGTGAPIINVASLAAGVATKPFTLLLGATGATPITFTATGLPTGLAVSGSSIAGSPQVTGTFTVTVNASNSVGPATAQTLTLLIGPASGAPIIARPGGSVPSLVLALGDDVSYDIIAAGTAPLTFTAAGLPNGIVLTGSTLSGIALKPGTSVVTLTAVNAAGQDSAPLTITISGTSASGTITIKESSSTSVGRDDNGDGTFTPIGIVASNYTATAKMDLTGLTTTFQSGTPYKVSIGSFQASGVLGDSPTFKPGKSATFLTQIDKLNANGDTVGTITTITLKLTYTAKNLSVGVISKDNDKQDSAQYLYLGDFLGTSDPIMDTTHTAVITLGTTTAIYNLNLTGKAPLTRTVNAGSGDNATTIDLESASLSGKGTVSK